jgi:hypothetical protein
MVRPEVNMAIEAIQTKRRVSGLVRNAAALRVLARAYPLADPRWEALVRASLELREAARTVAAGSMYPGAWGVWSWRQSARAARGQ